MLFLNKASHLHSLRRMRSPDTHFPRTFSLAISRDASLRMATPPPSHRESAAPNAANTRSIEEHPATANEISADSDNGWPNGSINCERSVDEDRLCTKWRYTKGA
ncbi:hypothetical protein QCA50_021051 [Cerrena zonata]|uniref:Uncharacterized protein n=1 Tax=Cerrena zonata TaxID=2478898 RepID=A0AAW0FBV9_9APHY